MPIVNQRFEGAIKWKKLGKERHYFQIELKAKDGLNHELTVTRFRSKGVDLLVMLCHRKGVVTMHQANVYGLSLARGLNELMTKRFGIIWKVGDAPNAGSQSLVKRVVSRDRMVEVTRRDLEEKRLEVQRLRAEAELLRERRAAGVQRKVNAAKDRHKEKSEGRGLRSMKDID